MAEQDFQYSNHPREKVTWYQAVAFCRWLTAKYRDAGLLPDGQEIRLPTEREWEIAARYPDGCNYPWGGEDYLSGYANVNETLSAAGPYDLGTTTAVGLYPQGRQAKLELDDLAGNVWEWCLNKDENSERVSSTRDEIWGRRGGSWVDDVHDARCASRSWYGPSVRYNSNGFRVVLGVSI